MQKIAPFAEAREWLSQIFWHCLLLNITKDQFKFSELWLSLVHLRVPHHHSNDIQSPFCLMSHPSVSLAKFVIRQFYLVLVPIDCSDVLSNNRLFRLNHSGLVQPTHCMHHTRPRLFFPQIEGVFEVSPSFFRSHRSQWVANRVAIPDHRTKVKHVVIVPAKMATLTVEMLQKHR